MEIKLKVITIYGGRQADGGLQGDSNRTSQQFPLVPFATSSLGNDEKSELSQVKSRTGEMKSGAGRPLGAAAPEPTGAPG